MPNDDRIISQLTELSREIALGNQRLEFTAEKLRELGERMGRMEERIGQLELADASSDGEKKAAERTQRSTTEWVGIVFSTIGVIGSVIGGAWALFVRGER